MTTTAPPYAEFRIEHFDNWPERPNRIRITHLPSGSYGEGWHRTSGLEAKRTAVRMLESLIGQSVRVPGRQ